MSSVSLILQKNIGGVGRRPLWRKNSLITNQFHSRNNISNNNLGRTTYVATNLRSFSPRDPNNMNKRPDCNHGHGSNRQWHHSAQDHHAHQGSKWAESEATCRFHTQFAQFDTGTNSFLKRARPLASQLILAK